MASVTSNSPLPPSVEAAYYRKCIQLKRRINEIEESNDAVRLRKARVERAILKLRLERTFLLEQIESRMANNVDESDDSESPPPTVREAHTSRQHPTALVIHTRPHPRGASAPRSTLKALTNAPPAARQAATLEARPPQSHAAGVQRARLAAADAGARARGAAPRHAERGRALDGRRRRRRRPRAALPRRRPPAQRPSRPQRVAARGPRAPARQWPACRGGGGARRGHRDGGGGWVA